MPRATGQNLESRAHESSVVEMDIVVVREWAVLYMDAGCRGDKNCFHFDA